MAQPIASTPKVEKKEAFAHLNRLAERQRIAEHERIAETNTRQERILTSKWDIREV